MWFWTPSPSEGISHRYSTSNTSSSGTTSTDRALLILPVYGSLLLKAGQMDTEQDILLTDHPQWESHHC